LRKIIGEEFKKKYGNLIKNIIVYLHNQIVFNNKLDEQIYVHWNLQISIMMIGNKVEVKK
jgi:hypothetical protein